MRDAGGLHYLLGQVDEIIMVFDSDGQLRYANRAVERLLGRPTSAYPSVPFDLVHPDDQDAVINAWHAVATTPGAQCRVHFRMLNADGRWVWFQAEFSNCLDDPAVAGVVVHARDVSAERDLETYLHQLSFYDPLTDLPNRALLMDRLQLAMQQASKRANRLAVVMLDLDHFKLVNEALGHAVGNEVLRELAQRLSRVLRLGDTLARTGDDEFVALLPDTPGEGETMSVADRLRSVINTPLTMQEQRIELDASVGVALSHPGEIDPTALLRAAGSALHRAKAEGRGRVILFSPGMKDDAARRLTLTADIRSALERGDFVLAYQPVIALDTGAVSEVEALLRWTHPSFGLVPPDEFIPLAETSRQIVPLGEWVIAEACRQVAEWGAGSPPVAVNVSARQLQAAGFVEHIERCLAQTGIAPGQLTVEVTERVLVDDVVIASARLGRLRSLGVRVAVDDFGTGYSSLRYLRHLPIDTVKIDHSFVRGLDTDPGALAMVEGIVALAHAIGLSVTAEGIETVEQLLHLRSAACNHGQGFLLAKPAPPDGAPPVVTLPAVFEPQTVER